MVPPCTVILPVSAAILWEKKKSVLDLCRMKSMHDFSLQRGSPEIPRCPLKDSKLHPLKVSGNCSEGGVSERCAGLNRRETLEHRNEGSLPCWEAGEKQGNTEMRGACLPGRLGPLADHP